MDSLATLRVRLVRALHGRTLPSARSRACSNIPRQCQATRAARRAPRGRILGSRDRASPLTMRPGAIAIARGLMTCGFARTVVARVRNAARSRPIARGGCGPCRQGCEQPSTSDFFFAAITARSRAARKTPLLLRARFDKGHRCCRPGRGIEGPGQRCRESARASCTPPSRSPTSQGPREARVAVTLPAHTAKLSVSRDTRDRGGPSSTACE
jgi:hypothetical protein